MSKSNDSLTDLIGYQDAIKHSIHNALFEGLPSTLYNQFQIDSQTDENMVQNNQWRKEETKIRKATKISPG